jgi:hypothetical protein
MRLSLPEVLNASILRSIVLEVTPLPPTQRACTRLPVMSYFSAACYGVIQFSSILYLAKNTYRVKLYYGIANKSIGKWICFFCFVCGISAFLLAQSRNANTPLAIGIACHS